MPDKPGRPPLPPGAARTKVVAVRLTEKGHARVKALADAKNLSIEGYVRKVLQMLAEGTLLVR